MADSWENQQSRQKSCTCAGRDIAPLRILLDCCKYLQIWRRSYIPGVAGKVVQLTGKPAQVYSQESYQWIYYSKVVSFKLRKKKLATCFARLLRNELKRNGVRLPPTFKPVLQQIRLLQIAWILTDWMNLLGSHAVRVTCCKANLKTRNLYRFCCKK